MDALPYGSWPSPLTADAVTAAAPRLDGARFGGDEIWWGESVPAEGGRVAVRRRRADGVVETVLPAPWNARSSVHEYGGGAWAVTDDDVLVFVERTDGRVWSCRPGAAPHPLTPDDASEQYGGLRWQEGRLLAIRETHGDARTPRREIVSVPLDASTATDPDRVEVLAGGADFLAQPALSRDGRLAWIEWDHPAMPWDRTRLCVREPGGDPIVLRDRGTAPLQPEWDGDDLLFADDPAGRWNLFRISAGEPSAVSPADADTGGALWVLGARWYGVLDDGRVLAVRTHGSSTLVVIGADGAAVDLGIELGVDLSAGVTVEDVRGSRALVIGAGRRTESAVWLLDLDAGSAERVTASAAPWDDSWLPTPGELTVDGPHGPVHAIDYPPTNPEVDAPADELPPYLVWVHGGPTSQAQPSASAKVAYFTSRGIGVLDVDYGGSTGYGRAYRERLRGAWGVVDVDDVAAAASGLAASGRADPGRLAIEGGSAGGWTVLAALANTDVFAAGISRYGVGDARTLAEDTHDFESHYLDGLIGPLPEAEDVYLERSPLSHPERFRVPLLILQGGDDTVVPPAQAEAIRDALIERGVPHGYVLYEGEGHGFRRRETVVHALESEYAFLGDVFGFATPGVAPFALWVGAVTVTDGTDGRELVMIPGAPASGHAGRDVGIAVSREPIRPLYARAPDAAWAAVLAGHGFTPTEDGRLVLMPSLDGA